MDRNLDGCYFRVERNDKWENVCFSDLTKKEREKVTENRDMQWLKSLCFYLADKLKEIGDQFGIEGGSGSVCD